MRQKVQDVNDLRQCAIDM